MSRAVALAQRLRALKEERDEISERKSCHDHDANRAVNALLRFTKIVEKESGPDIRPRVDRQESNKNIEQDETSGPVQEAEPEKDDSQSAVPVWAKKAFRMIAMKTHPDKVNSDPSVSDSQRDKLVSLYREASVAFREGKYETLAEVAAELDIEVDISQEEMETALERKITSLRDEMSKMQKTLSWVWGASFGDTQTRCRVLKQMCVILKIRQPDEKVLLDIIKELESQPDFDIIDRLGNVRRIRSGADRRKLGTRPERRIR